MCLIQLPKMELVDITLHTGSRVPNVIHVYSNSISTGLHIGETMEKSLRNLEIKFERYDLVICDELGYVGFDKEGAEMLFNHLSLRTGKKSTIITTNLPFTRWEEVLKDKVLCSALVDRLCHKSYLVNMTGTSYRIKETKKYISNK